jgi:hypothetical protein
MTRKKKRITIDDLKKSEDEQEAQESEVPESPSSQRFAESLTHQVYVPRRVSRRDAADFVQSLFSSSD